MSPLHRNSLIFLIILEAWKFISGRLRNSSVWLPSPVILVILQGAQEQFPLQVQEDGAHPMSPGHQTLLATACSFPEYRGLDFSLYYLKFSITVSL